MPKIRLDKELMKCYRINRPAFVMDAPCQKCGTEFEEGDRIFQGNIINRKRQDGNLCRSCVASYKVRNRL